MHACACQADDQLVCAGVLVVKPAKGESGHGLLNFNINKLYRH